jgi:rare lipoprotein A
MRRTLFLFISFITLSLLWGCGDSPRPDPRHAYVGLASHYGPEWEGRRTASGEIFHNRALTAADRTLPFGTRVRVTSLRTGKSVIVRINDRGPFVRGRVIDLSDEAAQRIGLGSQGVVPVRLEVLGS